MIVYVTAYNPRQLTWHFHGCIGSAICKACSDRREGDPKVSTKSSRADASACCFAAPRMLQSWRYGHVTHGCSSFAFAGQASVGPFACAAQVSARFVVCLFACLFYVVCVTFRCDVWLWFVLSVLVCCVGLCVTVRCEVWSWFVLSALVCCALACGAVCSGTISWACSQEMLANVPSPSGRARNYYYYYYRYCYNYDDEEKEEDGVYRYY